MDLLKAPTDNLYKFIALSGMATFALMCVLIHRHVELEISRLVEHGSALIHQSADLEGIKLKLASQGIDVSDPSPQQSVRDQYKIVGDEEVIRIIATIAKAESLLREFETRDAFFPLVLRLYQSIAVLALIVALFGFWLW